MAEDKTNVTLGFEIYSGGRLVRTEQLAQSVIKIGKQASSHLRIDDEDVSRMHAVIEVGGPDEVYVIDLGSSSGTFVNGQKVNKSKLKSGDEITLGQTSVRVSIGAAAAAAAPAPTAAAAAPAAPARPAPPAAAKPAASAPLPPPSAPKAPAKKPAANPFGMRQVALANPFAPPPPMDGSAPEVDESDPEKVHYGIVASGPPVSAGDVETADQAVEVVVMWGDRTVLHVEHLNPPRNFVVGEAEGPKDTVDYLIGSEALGVPRYPVVVSEAGAVWAVVPGGATGELLGSDGSTPFDQVPMVTSAQLPGAQQLQVHPGQTARIRYRGFTFMVKPVPAGKKIAAGFNPDWVPVAYVGGSALLFMIIGLIFYFSPPRSSALSGDLIDQNNRLVQFLLQPPETEDPEMPDWLNTDSNEPAGGTGRAHEGESGAMGDTKAPRTKNRYGIEGNANPEDQQMARQEAREMARTAGILGTLASMQGAWNSPTSPYGGDTAIGADPMSALGAMMGESIGANSGFGGLGLSGTGAGGGGTGQGTIGMGNFGTIGHGGGRGSGQGYGDGAGGLRGRESSVPQVRAGSADVRGSLSAEVIRRVVRRHTNEVRFCYEQGLNSNPELAGRVQVRFVITPTGAVQTSMVAGSSLGNRNVENCIATAVRRWSFPAPDGGGIVIVNYPFMLQSGG